jgi:hypothetical protein
MFKKVVVGFSFFVLMASCEDPELNQMMDEYCDCISTSRYSEGSNFECIELMDSIQKKYEHQPRKLNKVLEKTNECY